MAGGLFVLLFPILAACDVDPPPVIPPGSTAENPAVKTGPNPLTLAAWTDLLTGIAAEGKYVALDLSACTVMDMDGDNTADTVFDPRSAIVAGKDRIVSLIMPVTASRVAAGLSPSDPAFKGFTVLRIAGGANVLDIGDYAFSGCTTLREANFPHAVTIGDAVFSGCTALKELNCPEATDAGDGVFSGCTALTRVGLAAAAAIGDNVFSGCTALTSVDLRAAAAAGSNAFLGCTALAVVRLPAAAAIGGNAFDGCIALVRVDIEAAAAIGGNAFGNTGGAGLFILMGDTAPATLGTDMFGGVSVPKAVTVQVPDTVPATGSAYGNVPHTYNTDTGTGNWGNGFRGGGWAGGVMGSGTVNPSVTLIVQHR
jgi:hypothetical protein